MGSIAFLFPGQGSQKVGMGQDLFDHFDSVRSRFETASALLGYDLAKVCFEGPMEELTRTTVAQPALLTLGVACHDLVVAQGFECAMAAGHSLGEYAALVAAGAMDFAVAVRVVKRRAELMAAAPPGSMAAILGLSREQIEDVCREAADYGIVQPANLNSPGQIVISGTSEAVARASNMAKEKEAARVIPLPVSGGFHSPLLEDAGNELTAVLEAATMSPGRFPVIANATAQPVQSPEEIRFALSRQMTSSVLWEDTIRAMLQQGVDTLIELGPGRVLSGLCRRISKDVRALNVEDCVSLETTIAALTQG